MCPKVPAGHPLCLLHPPRGQQMPLTDPKDVQHIYDSILCPDGIAYDISQPGQSSPQVQGIDTAPSSTDNRGASSRLVLTIFVVNAAGEDPGWQCAKIEEATKGKFVVKSKYSDIHLFIITRS